MKKVAAIIEARMASTRLPGKVLKKHADKTLIEIMVKRLQGSLLTDEVIVASTTNPKDDELCCLLKSKGIKYYRGSEDDVLERVLECARVFGVDIIVEVTGDCPLLDPILVDQAIGFFFKAQADYIGNTCTGDFYPRGQDVKVFSTETLEEVNSLTDDVDDHEHVSLYIYNNQDYFKCYTLPPPLFSVPDKTRLTVDYPQDFQLVTKLLDALGHSCTFHDICVHLSKHKELLDINGNLNVQYINDTSRYASTS
jgi:spore coat polysaccharide biosynthesis protein SpsF